MSLKDKLRIRRFEKYWKRSGRKKLFTNVHRYLRLHKELLEDEIYQNLYNFTRNTLIAYFKRDHNDYDMSDEERGEFIDMLADIFNRNAADIVNKYQSLVEKLYDMEKETPSHKDDIRV